jgi:hypothetical protein
MSKDRDDDAYSYVFFHEQGTEHVVNEDDLRLAFGSSTKSE